MATLNLVCAAFPFYQEVYEKPRTKPLVLSLCAGLLAESFLLKCHLRTSLACLHPAFFLNSSLFPRLVFRDAKSIVIFLRRRHCMLLLSNAYLPDDSVTFKNFMLLFLPLILALCSDAYASGICKNTVSA